MKTEIQIDAAFIRRVYRTSLAVGALAAWTVYTLWGWTAVIGLSTGFAIALASLWVWERAIGMLVKPGAPRSMTAYVVGLGLTKMLVIGVVLTVVLGAGQQQGANLLVLTLGVAGGFFLVHVVIFLKAVGIWLLGKGVALTPADRPRLR